MNKKLYAHISRLSRQRFKSFHTHLVDYTLPLKKYGMFYLLLGFLAFIFITAVSGWAIYEGYNFPLLLTMAVQACVVIFSLIFVFPSLVLLLFDSKKGLATFEEPKNFLLRFFTTLLVAYFLLWIGGFLAAFFDSYSMPSFAAVAHYSKALAKPYHSFYLCWIAATLLFMIFFKVWSVMLHRRVQKKYIGSQNKKGYEFRLWLGTSTGQFSKLLHGASIPKGKSIALGLSDAAQNILVFGGIGAGKTSHVFHPLLLQFLDQDCGGIIFDIKNNFHQAVDRCAEVTDRKIIKVGIKHAALNLIEGLKPETAGHFLKSCFSISDQGRADSFWVDTAAALCKNTLEVLSFFEGKYNLNDMFQYIFRPEYKEATDKDVHVLLSGDKLSFEEKRILKNSYEYRQIFDAFDPRTISGVQGNVLQILSPFNHPDMVDAFSSTSDVCIEDVINKGAIFLIQVPLPNWGMAGKSAYNMIKLRFFNVMQQRESQPNWNKKRPVFFMCDEYQEIVSANKDGTSDLSFWDKSRSSKTIGVISAQAITSFYAVLQQRDLADAILQNFRQKLCFKTEDETTIRYFSRLAGQVEVEKKSVTRQSGSSTSSGSGNYGSSGSNYSNSETSTTTAKDVIDAQLFRKMQPSEVLAMLSIEGYSRDDILKTEPIII